MVYWTQFSFTLFEGNSALEECFPKREARTSLSLFLYGVCIHQSPERIRESASIECTQGSMLLYDADVFLPCLEKERKTGIAVECSVIFFPIHIHKERHRGLRTRVGGIAAWEVACWTQQSFTRFEGKRVLNECFPKRQKREHLLRGSARLLPLPEKKNKKSTRVC